MLGHIRKRGKDSWQVIIELPRDLATGRRRQLRRTFRGTKKDAESAVAQLIFERDTGIDQPPGKVTLAQYLTQWLESYARGNVAPRTLESYQGIIRKHLLPALGSVLLSRLRPQHIQAYYGQALERLSPRSVLHHHRVLRESLAHAVRWQLLARNPADAVQPPRPPRPETPAPDPEALRRLVEAADSTPYQPLIHLAVMTGLRQGELLGLRWSDLDLERGALSVKQALQWVNGVGISFRAPKTHRSRRALALSAATVQVLRRHRQRELEQKLASGPLYQEHGLVFCQPDGRPIDPSNFRRAWRRVVRQAGVGHMRFHDLRHAHASLLLAAGIHPKIVSERLGHSSVSITMDTYSHLLPGLQAEAVARLDQWLETSKAGGLGG